MAIEKWIATGSIVFFALFAALMITVYNFMINIPSNDSFFGSFPADEKLLQFISMAFGPAGILAGVAFIMSKRYGSKQIGGMIIAGGIIMFVGMYVCYSMVDKIDENIITDSVRYLPLLFMVVSVPVMLVGAYLFKQKKKRRKKQFF